MIIEYKILLVLFVSEGFLLLTGVQEKVLHVN